jgi:hypothetical protein
MKSHLNWQTYQNLELIPNQAPQKGSQRSLGDRLKDIWQRAIAYLETSSEPRVWQTRDVSGQTVWSAYDPIRKRSIEQVSVQEMRAWLEERHYHDDWVAEERLQQLKAEQFYALR